MTTQEIHTIVMETFQKQGENPNAPFQTSHLFLQTLELRFAICFKNSDYHRHYNPDQLAEKIKARIENPRGNMIIIQERIADRKPHKINAAATLIYISILAWFNIHLVSLIATVAFGISIWWLIRNHRRDAQHNQRLLKKMHADKLPVGIPPTQSNNQAE